MNIIQNIYSIIAVGALIILNLVAIAKGVAAIVKSIQDAKSATEEEKQAAKDAIIKNLQQVIFGWVTDAEKDLGGGTGKLKASKVAAMIYQYIPDELKPLFTPQEIQDMIDTALAAAKEYWEKNGKAKEYIESGATAMLAAEVDAVKAADGIPVEEVVKAVGAGVSEAIKTAMEAAKEADGAATVEVTAETEVEATAETKEE
jgi:hypothetical protein